MGSARVFFTTVTEPITAMVVQHTMRLCHFNFCQYRKNNFYYTVASESKISLFSLPAASFFFPLASFVIKSFK